MGYGLFDCGAREVWKVRKAIFCQYNRPSLRWDGVCELTCGGRGGGGVRSLGRRPKQACKSNGAGKKGVQPSLAERLRKLAPLIGCVQAACRSCGRLLCSATRSGKVTALRGPMRGQAQCLRVRLAAAKACRSLSFTAGNSAPPYQDAGLARCALVLQRRQR